jgi:arylsulfatase A-like enzyme
MIPVFLLPLLLCAAPALADPADGSEPLPNVLLITVDTLRADHLSCYGYHLKTTPNIDRLASKGVRFDRAYTPIPLTGPAHFSLLTSRYPQEHGARINGVAHREDARLLFLPQILRKFGYRNAAFISAWPLTSRLTHLDTWFDHYDEDLVRTYQVFSSSRHAEDVTPRAIEWLEANDDRPFFLWVHYFDPHSPYELREKFAKLEGNGDWVNGSAEVDEETRERVRNYDSEVAHADDYIGRLLGVVDELKLRQSTLVVLAADHGESLGEHDYVGHGRHLYENIVRVPLMFRFPGVVEAGKVVEERVSLLDVTPTILELTVKRATGDLQLPVPFAGRSLAPHLNGDSSLSEQTIRYVTYAGKKGFMPRWFSFLWVSHGDLPLRIGHAIGPRKVIWTPEDKSLEIFDVSRDPLELSPIAPRTKTSPYKLETTRLKRWYKSTAGRASEVKMTEQDIKVLRSLGYIQ